MRLKNALSNGIGAGRKAVKLLALGTWEVRVHPRSINPSKVSAKQSRLYKLANHFLCQDCLNDVKNLHNVAQKTTTFGLKKIWVNLNPSFFFLKQM